MLQTPSFSEKYEHGFQSYPCMLKLPSPIHQIHKKRNEWMDLLLKKAYQQGCHPCSSHADFYAEKYNLHPEDYPNAFRANHCSISLPLFHGMKKFEYQAVIDTVRETIPESV